MKLNQLSASQFADEIGVQRSSISHVLTGRNKPSLEFIQKIIKRYPKVDASWLIDGSTNVIPIEEKIALVEPKTNSEEIQKNETPIAKSEFEEKNVTSNISVEKKIKKILVFYEDNTFEEFNS
jgi:transcriptional regulator with XRE-family HTH domain